MQLNNTYIYLKTSGVTINSEIKSRQRIILCNILFYIQRVFFFFFLRRDLKIVPSTRRLKTRLEEIL